MEDLIRRSDAINELEKEVDEYWTGWDMEYAQSIKEAITIIESIDAAREWIPVTERLPETHGLYMVTFDNGNVYVARYDGGWYTIDSYGLLSMSSYVVAWMPLPEPYKEVT